jgi:hypothetical protein
MPQYLRNQDAVVKEQLKKALTSMVRIPMIEKKRL